MDLRMAPLLIDLQENLYVKIKFIATVFSELQVSKGQTNRQIYQGLCNSKIKNVEFETEIGVSIVSDKMT